MRKNVKALARQRSRLTLPKARLVFPLATQLLATVGLSAFPSIAFASTLEQELANTNNALAIAFAAARLAGQVDDFTIFILIQRRALIEGSIRGETAVDRETDGFKDPLYGTIAPLGSDPRDSTIGTGIALNAAGVPVVVGYSDTDSGGRHAFMWTLAGGTGDLGTLPLGGVANVSSSFAYGISADASTIVGSSITGASVAVNNTHAFRYTVADHTMRDLGTLTGTGDSEAFGVNDNGSVVVGQSSAAGLPGGEFHAFRWVQTPGTNAGTMTDIDNRAGATSFATATNIDGSVVVGGMNPGNGTALPTLTTAFRWTAATGMVNLGTLGTDTASLATAVDSDGRIVVGYSGIEGLVPNLGAPAGSTAFRWTAATGMQSLKTLLTNAGVNTTGITFASANGISSDGQFIVGAGIFPDTAANSTSGFLVRYCDATNMSACAGTGTDGGGTGGGGGSAIAGVTTAASVQASIDQVAAARRMVLIQEFGEAAQLLGANERIGSGSEIGVFAAGGTDDSLDGGAAGRVSYGNGFSILAGAAGGEEHYANVHTDTTFMGALALRYIYDTNRAWRPYGEAGVWGVPGAAFTFTRTYANGSGTSVGSSTVSASKYYAYGRAGATFTPDPADEWAGSIEVGQGALHTGAFAEQFSPIDPFQATGFSATDETTVGKLRLQWTHAFTAKIDATVWGAGAESFHYNTTYAAGVPGFGLVTPTHVHRPAWAEYGGRIGYKITPAAVVDVYADGVSGDRTIGTDVRVGTGFQYLF